MDGNLSGNIYVQLLTGAIGGALISSVLGPYFTQSKERRQARADVLNALMQVENTRWADSDTTFIDFRKAVTTLKAVALVAGVNSEITDTYTRLASIARRTSQDDFDEATEEDIATAGGIPVALSDLTRDAAEVLILAIRHPFTRQWQRRKLLNALAARTKEVKKTTHTHPPVDWDAKDF